MHRKVGQAQIVFLRGDRQGMHLTPLHLGVHLNAGEGERAFVCRAGPLRFQRLTIPTVSKCYAIMAGQGQRQPGGTYLQLVKIPEMRRPHESEDR